MTFSDETVEAVQNAIWETHGQIDRDECPPLAKAVLAAVERGPEWKARQVGVSEDEAIHIAEQYSLKAGMTNGEARNSYLPWRWMYRALRKAGVISNGWQKIETAPKDGTRFIAGRHVVRISRPNYFEWYVCVYAGECKIETDDEEWGVEGNDGCYYCPEGFYREGQDRYGEEHYFSAKPEPTHWMPLPTPPVTKEG